jgi:hypothetical protein
MAGKKMKKAAKKEACCSTGGYDNLEEWLLVILGGLGFAQALGYLNLAPFYFAYVWSALVLVIGIKKVIDKSNCC